MRQKNPAQSQTKNELVVWIRSIAIAIVIAILIRAALFEVVSVSQTSMFPTLREGDRLGVVKCAYWVTAPSREDIVIARVGDSKYYVKRVLALPGERVAIKSSTVYIDGEPLAELYLIEDLVYPDFEEITVPEGCYFLLGDNRAGSIDSRSEAVGCVAQADIISKVAFRFVPFRWFW